MYNDKINTHTIRECSSIQCKAMVLTRNVTLFRLNVSTWLVVTSVTVL